MNIFATMLHGHPEVVDALAERAGDTASFDDIVAVVEGHEFPLVLDRDVGEVLKAQEPFGHLLEEGYLPIVDAEQWQATVREAEETDEREAAEWVTFARGHGSRGVSVPDDSHPALQVSLFTRFRDVVCRLGIDYQAAEMPPSGMSVAGPVGCSLPDWGTCADGECGGDCMLVHRPEARAFFCRCPRLS